MPQRRRQPLVLLDGRTLGRARIEQYRAELDAVYQPGELVAIARRDGVDTGRTSLRTATGELQLRLSASPDRFTDVAFVVMELVDALGTVHTGADREVEVRVDGPAELLGLGSAAPASEESFLEPRCRLYRGRALAVLRATGSGPVEVIVSSPGCELQSAGLSAGSALG